MKNPKTPFRPTPSFIIGSILETLSLVLFVLVFNNSDIGSFALSAYPKPWLYTIATIGFAIGFALVLKNILEIKESKKDIDE